MSKNIKMPLKLVDIKNPDKTGWTEYWTPNRAKDIANIPHPSRIAIVGPPSMGKSFLIKHLLMHQKPMFKEVYIIHGDSDVTKEFEDIEPTMMMSDIPPIEFFDGKVKTLVIIDDYEFSDAPKSMIARIYKLFRYVSSHKNVTIYVSHQNFFELPSLVRKLCNVFVIFKPRSTIELKLIATRIGIKPEVLSDIFRTICNDYRDSLTVDFNIRSPSVFRKNLFIPLNIESEYGDLK